MPFHSTHESAMCYVKAQASSPWQQISKHCAKKHDFPSQYNIITKTKKHLVNMSKSKKNVVWEDREVLFDLPFK